MPTSKSFWEHPIAKLEEALSLRKQIGALQDRLSGLFGSDDSTKATGRSGGKRTMSPEAREKIAAAQRRRWAKSKGQSSASSKPAKKSKGGITPEGRAKLAAAMKARWAARKKGAPALNAKK